VTVPLTSARATIGNVEARIARTTMGRLNTMDLLVK
jgi:hypothetical protein